MTTKQINNCVKAARKHVISFNKTYKILHLQQAGNKIYKAYVLLVENISKKDIRTTKGVRIVSADLKDKNLLQMLQEELQSGKININKDYNSVSFYINGYSNCFNIIEYFDDVLLGEKKKQFDSWKKIIIKYHENYKNNKFKNNIIKQIIKMRGY